jgi:hypothetical protein
VRRHPAEIVRGTDRPLCEAEFNRALGSASEQFEVVLRGLRAGLRIGDVAALDVAHARRRPGEGVTLRMQSAKLREIPRTAEIDRVLEDAIKVRLHSRIFETEKCKSWTDMNIRERVSKALRKARLN